MNYLKTIDYNDLKFIINKSGVLFDCIRKREISVEEPRHKQE